MKEGARDGGSSEQGRGLFKLGAEGASDGKCAPGEMAGTYEIAQQLRK